MLHELAILGPNQPGTLIMTLNQSLNRNNCGHAGSSWLSLSRFLGLCTTILLLAGFGQTLLRGATLTTDQADYPPYTYVYMNGSGFDGSEPVQLFLEMLNSDSITWSPVESSDDWPNPWEVKAVNGNIIDEWYVWTEDFLGMTFRLTATGESSGLTKVLKALRPAGDLT